jgi:uncharacterized secreted repeat protein (TIGR03808 family)
MNIDRRRLLALAAASALGPTTAARAAAPPISALGLDAAQFGLRPGSPDDQSRSFQRALDEAARARVPLAIPPGDYRVGNLKLQSGSQLLGGRGASRLVLTGGPSLLAAENADNVTISGVVLDGLQRRLSSRRGLVHIENGRGLAISNCEIIGAGGIGICCIEADGQLLDNTIADALDVAIHSLDARGLLIARNTVLRAGDNGIQV